MAYENRTSDSGGRSLTDRFGFPHLLATTVAFVSATILLGIAAKATGSGLACDANWPLCDGGLLNLFPATFPSFFEWIHRVVAGVAGFFIVGSAIAAWRIDGVERRVAAALTLGMVLTPAQVYLGRETVLQYELTILSLHFWTAIVIFLLFAVAFVWVWADRLTATHATTALAAGALSIPAHVALSPLFIGSYTPVVQTLQYAATLALLFAVVLATIVGRRRFDDRAVGVVLAALPPLAIVVVLLGRRAVMTYVPALDTLYVVASVVLFVALVAVGARSRQVPRRVVDSSTR